MNLITALANCAAYVAKWWTSDERIKATKANEKAALSAAVNTGDKDSVNAFLKKTLVIPAMVGLLLFSGCATRVVYVPADRAVYPMVSTNGVSGWFVPNTTFDELTQKVLKAN